MLILVGYWDQDVVIIDMCAILLTIHWSSSRKVHDFVDCYKVHSLQIAQV